MTSGLLIVSKVPIIRSTFEPFPDQVFFERPVVSRGALHCELEGGLHVVTCHLSPAAENCGPLSAFEGPIDGARTAQARQLAAFISRVANGGPVVMAGDLNL